MASQSKTPFNVDAPRWDQTTFVGRLKHFFNITDPRTALLSNSELERAKELVMLCRAGSTPPGTTVEQLHYAKKLYDSAFHPDTSDRNNIIGRMSFQVPGGLVITAGMLQFYRQIGMAYVTATSAALVTAVGLNLSTKSAPPLVARWVPFVAVAAANCVNIPMMRQQEIIKGIVVTDENGNELGHSRKAAVKGIAQVVVSRITIAAPGMIILPIVMQRLEKYAFMQRKRFLLGPIQLVLLGCFLTFMVPAGCALYPQTCSMEVSHLEPELQKSIVDKHGDAVARVFFNKGL
uniref:Sideroflexin-2 isoform X2 n=1 Tax=Petromyzon marinus TaxID=7757 RepID=A0AAJ7TLK1_PETMA|nr:sideroflexin-2 isoform X2 [Petromyzon marinus]